MSFDLSSDIVEASLEELNGATWLDANIGVDADIHISVDVVQRWPRGQIKTENVSGLED